MKPGQLPPNPPPRPQAEAEVGARAAEQRAAAATRAMLILRNMMIFEAHRSTKDDAEQWIEFMVGMKVDRAPVPAVSRARR
jgi:hypothetical protein